MLEGLLLGGLNMEFIELVYGTFCLSLNRIGLVLFVNIPIPFSILPDRFSILLAGLIVFC